VTWRLQVGSAVGVQFLEDYFATGGVLDLEGLWPTFLRDAARWVLSFLAQPRWTWVAGVVVYTALEYIASYPWQAIRAPWRLHYHLRQLREMRAAGNVVTRLTPARALNPRYWWLGGLLHFLWRFLPRFFGFIAVFLAFVLYW